MRYWQNVYVVRHTSNYDDQGPLPGRKGDRVAESTIVIHLSAHAQLPAGGDDLGALLVVGDGEGAGGGALPEGLGIASLVVDGVG